MRSSSSSKSWSTSMIESTFLPADDFRTCMWDLTCFPAVAMLAQGGRERVHSDQQRRD